MEGDSLLLAYLFWNMFFIGQNLKHVHMTFSFLELLIFFWLPLADTYCLEFFSDYIKEILYVNANSKRNQSSNRNKVIYISTCLWYWCWKILLFSCWVEIPYQQLIFFMFHEHIYLKLISKSRSYKHRLCMKHRFF